MQNRPKLNQIIQIDEVAHCYHTWASHPKAKSFPAMFALVLLNSNFYELTQTCQKSHRTRIHYFYEFEELEIVSLSKSKTEATIRGGIKLNISGLDSSYKGKFISNCCREDPSTKWKLNDIEIEWE